MTTLVERIGLGDREVVSLVGAGGKTTTLLCLGSELARSGKRVLMTTTTKMGLDQLPEWASVRRTEDNDAVAGPVFVVGDVVGEKVIGVSPEYVDRVFASGAVDYVVVEADGARRRSLKAPAPHEPVIPSSTSTFVAVAGLDALGHRVGDVAHRPELVCRLTGGTPDDLVSAADIATVLGHAAGGLQGAPEHARVVAMITKASPETADAVAEILERLQRISRIERVVVEQAGRSGGLG